MVTGGWSKLHELQNEKHVRIRASPNIVRGAHIKDDVIGGVEARMALMRNIYNILDQKSLGKETA